MEFKKEDKDDEDKKDDKKDKKKDKKKKAGLSIRAKNYEQKQQSEIGGPELQSLPAE